MAIGAQGRRRDTGTVEGAQEGRGHTPAAKPDVAGAKKPFSMSYGGVSTAEHIAYRISRGAR